MNNRNLFNLILGLFLLFILAIGCTSSSKQSSTDTKSAASAPTGEATKTPDEEKEELKKKVEELEKKVDSQEKSADQQQVQRTPPPVRQPPPVVRGSGTYARVNSPGDGFLAMRSEPSSSYGYRILQIPHGSTISVLGCQNYMENVGGRTGRWCRVNYAGYTGWAFDGWLVY
jgi:hypothetical protein